MFDLRVFVNGVNLQSKVYKIKDLDEVSSYLTQTEEHVTVVVTLKERIILMKCSQVCLDHKIKPGLNYEIA